MFKILRCRKGASQVKVAVLVIAVAMIFSAVFAYVTLMITITRTREDTQRVLDSFIIENAEAIYNSVKNGNHTTLTTNYNTRFRELVAAELGLTRSGTLMYSEGASRNIIFHYNNPVTTNIRDGVLELQTRYEIVIPITFAGMDVVNVRVPITVRSLYVLK